MFLASYNGNPLQVLNPSLGFGDVSFGHIDLGLT